MSTSGPTSVLRRSDEYLFVSQQSLLEPPSPSSKPEESVASPSRIISSTFPKTDIGKMSALESALRRKNSPDVMAILSVIPPRARGRNDNTPLHLLAKFGCIEGMEYLLEKDSSLVSVFRKNGRTPFHSAAEGGHVGAMEYLLKKDSSLVSVFRKNGWILQFI